MRGRVFHLLLNNTIHKRSVMHASYFMGVKLLYTLTLQKRFGNMYYYRFLICIYVKIMKIKNYLPVTCFIAVL